MKAITAFVASLVFVLVSFADCKRIDFNQDGVYLSQGYSNELSNWM